MLRSIAVMIAMTLAVAPRLAGAQALCDSIVLRLPAPRADAPKEVQKAMSAQTDFENFRCRHLPPPKEVDVPVAARGARPACPEPVGVACYWYSHVDPPAEPKVIGDRRDQLIARLNTVAAHLPGDYWTSEQLVRYLDQAGRSDSALTAARACRATGWICDALVGFALHELGRYANADTAFAKALAKMSPDDRCNWRNIDLLLDEETRLWYQQLPCTSPTRIAFEDRAWFLSRTLYSVEDNDSRTEHYARKMMEMMLRDAPDVAPLADYRQLVLRYGWPRNWTMFDVRSSPFGRPGAGLSISALGEGRGLGVCRTCNGGAGSASPRGDGSKERDQLLHYEPAPAYRFVPSGAVLENPTSASATDWTAQDPPLPARYAPPYARSLSALDHQAAMFKRGDSAVVVVAYNAADVEALDDGVLTSAPVISRQKGYRSRATA